ncbi:unnamed protein product [Caenorhabditis auriculariae]|uniref:Uncharacterized protein n=1 Tax=Caenorhabditis auriculariae TaxID=2777116 RepID=A0A8S1HN49_9PELO|nr:unnamed protein product [Caenorhabditis auriculariae]
MVINELSVIELTRPGLHSTIGLSAPSSIRRFKSAAFYHFTLESFVVFEGSFLTVYDRFYVYFIHSAALVSLARLCALLFSLLHHHLFLLLLLRLFDLQHRSPSVCSSLVYYVLGLRFETQISTESSSREVGLDLYVRRFENSIFRVLQAFIVCSSRGRDKILTKEVFFD